MATRKECCCRQVLSFAIHSWCTSSPTPLMLLLFLLLLQYKAVSAYQCFASEVGIIATNSKTTCVFLSGSSACSRAYTSFSFHSNPRCKQSHECILSMKIRVAIVGLPNVGKSTLFNALAQKSIAQAENFPFCTIEPNRVPIAMMPDKYLQSLGTLAKSQKTIPASIELVDVAGLVAGASRGEGLGNQFLATVRECDAIIHVIRHFDDTNIIRVNGDGDGASSPLDDAEVVNLELLLADIAHVERRLEKTTCQKEERDTLEFLLPELRKGIPARAAVVKGGLSAEQEFSIKSMGLLTLKPVIYAFNVDEVDFLFDKDNIMKGTKGIFDSIQYCDPARDLFTIVSAKLAATLRTTNNPGETREYLQSAGFDDIAHGDDDDANQEMGSIMGYNDLLGMIRQLLDLFVVYVGPGVAPERSRTTRAFLVDGRKSKILSSASHSSTTALGLAGRLHGDIQKGFIRAEVISACQLLEFSSYKTAKDAGVVRTEGKDYVLQEDDVVLIKWK